MIRSVPSKYLVPIGGVLVLAIGCQKAPEPATARATSTTSTVTSTTGDESAQLQAIHAIIASGEHSGDVVKSLTQMLGDKSTKVRALAAHALGKIGEPAKPAAAALTELLKDQDNGVRRQAVKALTAIHPGPKVMIPLFARLMQDSDPGVQMRILGAITDAGPAAVPGLIEALDNDTVAYWACVILRDMGPEAKAAVPALTKKLKDPKPRIRREAALALGAMQQEAVSAVPELAAGLDDPHMQSAATFALGEIGQIPAAAEQKIAANTKSADKFLSTVSYWALARVHPDDKVLRKEATEKLIERLMDKDEYIRVAAARALGSLPPAPEITLPLWEQALKNADETTARYALDALATLGEKAVPRLIDALRYVKLRAEVAYVLGQIGPKAAQATDALAKMLEDKDTEVAAEAAVALGKIGPDAKAAVPALIHALQQKECPDAHAIILALGKIGPGAVAAEPEIVAAMKSPEPSLAAVSAWALVQLHPGSKELVSQAVPIIVAALSDPLAEARQAAAQELGSFGPAAAEAIPALEKAAQDPKPGVRHAAQEALAAIRPPKSA